MVYKWRGNTRRELLQGRLTTFRHASAVTTSVVGNCKKLGIGAWSWGGGCWVGRICFKMSLC